MSGPTWRARGAVGLTAAPPRVPSLPRPGGPHLSSTRQGKSAACPRHPHPPVQLGPGDMASSDSRARGLGHGTERGTSTGPRGEREGRLEAHMAPAPRPLTTALFLKSNGKGIFEFQKTYYKTI